MAHAFDIKTLVPEEYGGHKIYIQKETRVYGRRPTEVYRVQIRRDGIVVHDGIANSNFGLYQDNITKNDVILAAKKFIDQNLGPELDKVKVGDLFETSWGYDQTNYDYIIVTAVAPNGKSVKCQRAASVGRNAGFMTEEQLPLPQGYGPEFIMRVQYYRGKVELRGTYLDEHGEKFRLDTFSRVKPGRTYYETSYA